MIEEFPPNRPRLTNWRAGWRKGRNLRIEELTNNQNKPLTLGTLNFSSL